MFKANTFLVILLFTHFVSGQSYSKLFRITEGKYYGYIDRHGRVIIPPVFRYAGEFSEGLAPARKNSTYGFINKKGRYRIEPQFDYATEFINGYAIVRTGNKYFYINKKGEFSGNLSENDLSKVKEYNKKNLNEKRTSRPVIKEIPHDSLTWDTIENKTGNNCFPELKIIHLPSTFQIAIDSVSPYLPLEFDEYDPKGFFGGLLAVIIKGQLSYINTEGEIVWGQSSIENLIEEAYNVDYIYQSENLNKKLPKIFNKSFSVNGCGKDSLLIIPFPDSIFIHNSNRKGYKIHIVNCSKDTIIASPDFRIDCWAQSQEGNWVQAIEDINWGHWECGTSIYVDKKDSVHFPPKNYFTISMPLFEGYVKTKMMIIMKYNTTTYNQTQSFSFEGFINPAQLYRRVQLFEETLVDRQMLKNEFNIQY